MNFQTMDYFVAVAEEKSFTHAAERLSITQQTLSAHIAMVERELGVRLVNRKVPLTLTYAGEVFLGYARRFQAMQRTMEQEFRDIAKDERGLLGVGVASTRGHMIMPRALAHFQREHPGINVLLSEGENKELLDLLAEGRVDMVVASVPPGTPGLVIRELYDEKIVLMVSDALLEEHYGDEAEARVAEVERTGSLAAMGDLPYMMLGREDEPGSISRRLLAASGVTPWVRVHSKNSETLVDLAAEGMGACFVPLDLALASLADHADDGLRMVNLGSDLCISISVAWKDTGHVWSVIEAFADTLANPALRTLREGQVRGSQAERGDQA